MFKQFFIAKNNEKHISFMKIADLQFFSMFCARKDIFVLQFEAAVNNAIKIIVLEKYLTTTRHIYNQRKNQIYCCIVTHRERYNLTVGCNAINY